MQYAKSERTVENVEAASQATARPHSASALLQESCHDCRRAHDGSGRSQRRALDAAFVKCTARTASRCPAIGTRCAGRMLPLIETCSGAGDHPLRAFGSLPALSPSRRRGAGELPLVPAGCRARTAGPKDFAAKSGEPRTAPISGAVISVRARKFCRAMRRFSRQYRAGEFREEQDCLSKIIDEIARNTA